MSTGASASLSTPTAQQRRDIAIDLVRCFCVISMTVGHIASSWPLTLATHPVLYSSGASGFVMLSGLVLGKVQR